MCFIKIEIPKELKSIINENQLKKRLLNTYYHIKQVSQNKNYIRYENIPISENWLIFEEFYNDNANRYLTALKKCKNFKIIFYRKIKENGFTLDNTNYAGMPTSMKYRITAKKIFLEDRHLSIRDFSNILKKKNINYSLSGLTSRFSRNEIIPEVNRLNMYNWKGKYISGITLCELEKIKYTTFRYHVKQGTKTLQQIVDYCKSPSINNKYFFEGKKMNKIDICRILSKRTGIKTRTLRYRFDTYGFNIDLILCDLNSHKCSPVKKKILAVKDNIELKFDSIKEASRILEISSSNISTYVSGKRKGKLKGYNFFYI